MARRPGTPPSPWPEGDILALGDRAVKLALARGADEAESFLSWGASTSVDIEGNRISYPMQSSASGISIRVLKDGRLGFAYCTHREMLERAAVKALEISRLGKQLPFHFPDRSPLPRPKGTFDERLLPLTPEDGIRYSSEMIAEARRFDKGIQVTGGGVDFGFFEMGLVNSRGVALAEKGTAISAGAFVTLKGRTTSTGSEHQSARTMSLDFPLIGREAARLACASRDPVKTKTAPRTVLFTPEAAAELLGSVTVPSLEGEAVGRGESVYAGKLGEQVTSSALRMEDDGLLEGGLGTSASDEEGIPSRKTVLVRDGRLEGFLYDLYSAAEFGARTTGNGARGSYRTPPSVSARNIVIGGKLRDRDTLITEIGEGVLVHDILGAHTANRVSGDFSVSAPLLFRIKNGELGRPLKPVMLSGNLPELLRSVSGIGKDRKQIASGAGSIYTGSLRLENVMVTG